MRSASATAWRTACSHSARSTTAPPFTPCDCIWLYPINSTAWLRPRKASLGGHGFSRAIMQAILLVPISREAASAVRLAIGRVFGVWLRSRPGLLLVLLVLEQFFAGFRRIVGQLHRQPIRQPHVDCNDIAREQLLFLVEP